MDTRSRIAEKDHRSVKVEAEIHLAESGAEHGVAEAAAIGCMEEQKTTATGAAQLATGSAAVGAGEIVERIDAGGGHGAGARAFAHPVFVHEAAKVAYLAGFEGSANFVAEHACEMQAVEHGWIAGFGEAFLLTKQG